MSEVLDRPRQFALEERQPAADPALERLHRKQRLAATFRLFARYGFDQGLAGHVTVRDPENSHCYWVNPLGQHFATIRVSDLQLVDHKGNILVGNRPINQAGFVIHSAIHGARPDVAAAAHTHSTYGKAWSTLGRKLDAITQDSCAFYERHDVFDPFGGVVLEPEEGVRLTRTLGTRNTALILQNHGLLTVGGTIETAAWRFIAMDNAAHAQLLAEAAGKPVLIAPDIARKTAERVGTERGGIFSFQPLYDWITAAEPDLLD
jgi:ribulose-5-phosphate 4-epimerase/fuculose-1-phosphate aldolase